MATQPCKCGFLGDGTDRCQCSAASVEGYRAKLSGPMMDRIDIHVHLPRVDLKVLQKTDANGKISSVIKQGVIKARVSQIEKRGKLNNQLSSKELELHCALKNEDLNFLVNVCDKLNMSARAYHRILKLARTIADMADEKNISKAHLSEAVGYRTLDRR